MITKDNGYTHLKFGYGTLCVDSDAFSLKFQNIRPPQEVGKKLADVPDGEITFEGQIYATQMTYDDCKELRKYLNIIEKEQGGYFTFHGFMFDFEVYNIESINVIKRNIAFIESWYLRAIAC